MRPPSLKEEVLSERLGEPLKDLQVPPEIVAQIVDVLRKDQEQAQDRSTAERVRLEVRLTSIRNRNDAAYVDKLHGKISEEFWRRKTDEWTLEEHHVRQAIASLPGDQKTDRAREQGVFTYVSQNSAEKAKLLRMMWSNFSMDGITVAPPHRYPFDLIFKEPKLKNGRDGQI